MDRFDADVLSPSCTDFGCRVGDLLEYAPDDAEPSRANRGGDHHSTTGHQFKTTVGQSIGWPYYLGNKRGYLAR